MAVSTMSLRVSTQCANAAPLSMVDSRVSFIPARRLVSAAIRSAREVKIAVSCSTADLPVPIASLMDPLTA